MESKIPETVLISGGNGLIGLHLSARLKSCGFHVVIIGRSADNNSEYPQYTWDLNKNEIEQDAILKADYIIHLAGANIGERKWTQKRKQEIIDSRVKASQLLFEKAKENSNKIKAFISASATGYYGTVTTEKIYNENDLPGNDFLSETCKSWENAADRFQELGIRVVKIRTGIVLTKKGGALGKMLIPIKLGFGFALGSGNQYIPWIHIDDLCNIYLKAIEDIEMQGVYNAVASEHITNKVLIQTLCHRLKKPFWFPHIPALALRLFFGEMSDILIKGSRVSSDKIRKEGYNFLFPDLHSSIQNLLMEQ
jgi:uncharacterized protein